MPLMNYKAPPYYATQEVKLGWLKEQVTAGETFIKSQTASQDFDKAMAVIMGVNEEKIPDTLSRVRLNLTKRIIREMVSTLSNLRPFWGFKSDDRTKGEQEAMLNKLILAWFHNTFADRKIKGVLQYAGGMGTGWLSPTWQSDFWTTGRGDIQLKVYSPKDVLPSQLPTDNDIQRAYAASLREAVPINLAHAMFPEFEDKIIPDRQNPSRMSKAGGITGVAKRFLSPVLNRFASATRSGAALNSFFPEVDVYHTYIMDTSINKGNAPIVMGEPGTYWNYTVPFLGQLIPDATGKGTREATADDCKMYPLRRLIIWTNTCILRDGPSYWWHGKVPAVPFYFDEWVMEFLGLSLIRDIASTDESNNSLRRCITDAANARLRPALMYDDQTIAKALIEKIDPRKPAQAVGVDMSISETPIRPIYPANYYDVPSWLTAFIDSNEEKMKYQVGVNDYTALTKAAQVPSADTFEKQMEVAGPLIRDTSRSMESQIAQLGEMWKALCFEFYTADRRVQVLGRDGTTDEDFWYKVGSLIPGYLPWEDPDQPKSTQIERAKYHMNQFIFHVVPGSLHAITQMDRKLVYIQLSKAGVPIDPWTFADIFDLKNFGPPPADANTMMERWVAWERMKGELQAAVQAKAMLITAQAQMEAQLQAGIVQGAAGGGAPGGTPPAPGGPKPGDVQNSQGRQPTNEKPAHVVSKDGGERSTISTS